MNNKRSYFGPVIMCGYDIDSCHRTQILVSVNIQFSFFNKYHLFIQLSKQQCAHFPATIMS